MRKPQQVELEPPLFITGEKLIILFLYQLPINTVIIKFYFPVYYQCTKNSDTRYVLNVHFIRRFLASITIYNNQSSDESVLQREIYLMNIAFIFMQSKMIIVR